MPSTKVGIIAVSRQDASGTAAIHSAGRLRDIWSGLVVMANGRFARSVVLLSGGVIIGQAVCVASAPILTRLYRPEDLGELAVFVAAISLVSIMGAFRYEVAIPLPKEDEHARNVLALSVLAVFVTTTLFALVAWLFGQQFVDLTGIESLRSSIWLLPPGVFVAGLFSVSSMWLVRQRRYTQLATSSVLQALGQAGCQIAIGLGSVGAFGLLVGDVFGRAVGAGTLMRHCWSAFRTATPRGVLQAMVRYRRFPVVSSWAALINTASIHIPPLCLASIYGLQVVGWMALAQRILGMPTTLVSGSVAKVYLSECARLHHSSPSRLPSLFWKTLAAQSIMGGIVVVCVGLPAPLICGFVFGASWNTAGWYVLVLSAMFAAKMIAYPLGATLDVLEEQGWHVFREVVRLALALTAVLAAALWSLPPLTAVAVLSVASCLGYCVGILIAWHLVRGHVFHAK